MKSRVQPRLIIIAVCLYFLTILPFALFAQDNKPKKVLVLHSYHRGLSWNDAIDEGIETVFKESGLDIESRTEYMDTKRIHDPGYLRQLFGIYQTKFNKCKFDLIISTDNNALNFLLKHRDELFPQTPVVFCGVNNYQDAMLEGQKRFTGAVEDIDIREILDTALRLHPKTRQVVVYGSDTPTYFANKEHLKRLIPDYESRIDFRFVENVHIKEVQNDVRKLSDNSLILIISSVRDEQGVPMSFARGTEEMASVSRVPIYGCWDFLLGHGIMGGKLISGFTQGEAAAKMALRFLHGEKIKNIPVLKESPNRFMFDYKQMMRFGLTPSDLPQGSILINRPSSFYSEHKALVWAAVIAIFSLLLFIAGLGINIFRRKRAEASLRKSEERYRSLFDQSRDAIAIVRQDGVLLDVNRSFSDLFGYEREALMQMNAKDLWADPAKRSGWQEEMKEKGFISNYSWKTRRKDGEERDCIMTSTERRAEDGTVQYQTIARDVTDQNRSVEALEQSEEKYRTLVEESFDGIFVQEGPRIIFANRRLNEMLGYDENELLGMDHWHVYHPEHQEMVRERAKARMRGEKVTTQYEVKLQRKDGTWLYWEIIARAIGLEGKPGIQVWIKDIMERRLAEETLQQSEKRFRDLFDSITDLIYTQDIQGRFLSVNPAMSRILGYDHKYFIGMKAADFMKPQFRTQFENEYLKQIKTRGHYEGISSYFTKDGNEIYIEYHNNLVKPDEGDPYISGMGRDVTERISAEREIKNLQKQMHHAEKMESIGILAGGIAHDFNNLLMGIQGNASLMTLDIDAGHSHHEKLKNIEQYVQKGAGLTKQLLGFASGGKYEVKPTDLNRLIKNESRMFGRTKKEIRIHEKYDEALLIVAVDQGQMAQVMLNLYINAWQAMPGGGISMFRRKMSCWMTTKPNLLKWNRVNM